MKEGLTFLQEGIKVKIDNENFEKLKNYKGFLSRKNYFDSYEEISLKNEVGRFLVFRFMLEE